MLFDEQFITNLLSDPIAGTINLCDITLDKLKGNFTGPWSESDYSIFIEAYSLLVEVVDSGLIPLKVEYPAITGKSSEDSHNICILLRNLRSTLKAEASRLTVQMHRSKFRMSLGNCFAYEFSQGDLDRVQILLNQLRDLISSSQSFEKDHQQRLLQRLEKLQSEIHKKVSDLDRFWGLIGDAGVVAGKLGNDAKPIVDRIREIADIVWQTQSRAEELPSGTSLPSLEHKHSHTDEIS